MTPAQILAALDSIALQDVAVFPRELEICAAAAALIRAQQKRIEELEAEIKDRPADKADGAGPQAECSTCDGRGEKTEPVHGYRYTCPVCDDSGVQGRN